MPRTRLVRAARALARGFLRPSGPVLAVGAALSAALLCAVFLRGWEDSPAAYCAYALSAWALAQAVIALARLLPRLRARMGRFAAVTVDGPALASVAFAAYKSVCAVLYRSSWFGALAAYYALLAAARVLWLPRFANNLAPRAVERRWRATGLLLLALAAALAFAAENMLRHRLAARYPGHLVYAVAAFSFYSVFAAVRALLRARSASSPARKAAARVSLSAALVSLYMLQATLLLAFGDGELDLPMNLAMASVVFAALVGVAIHMLLRGARTAR